MRVKTGSQVTDASVIPLKNGIQVNRWGWTAVFSAVTE